MAFNHHITAKDHYFDNSGAQEIEAKQHDDFGLFVRNAQPDLAPSLRGQQDQCSRNRDHDDLQRRRRSPG
jgi:hypothetical protein